MGSYRCYKVPENIYGKPKKNQSASFFVNLTPWNLFIRISPEYLPILKYASENPG